VAARNGILGALREDLIDTSAESAEAIAGLVDPAEHAQREEELRRDLDRFESDRDSKIKRIRAGS